ncbi:hypothetical protein JW766_02755 [Candidatus Dojkabacteria bacterium]|nr:hypothetical protein [Candidatus Dojkabacteria bacterium]
MELRELIAAAGNTEQSAGQSAVLEGETYERSHPLLLTYQEALELVQREYPHTTFEPLETTLDSITARIETVFGTEVVNTIHSIYTTLPSFIKESTGESIQEENVQLKMLWAIRIFLETYPLEPTDLPGKGMHGTAWHGFVGGAETMIAAMILSGIRASFIDYDQQVIVNTAFFKQLPAYSHISIHVQEALETRQKMYSSGINESSGEKTTRFEQLQRKHDLDMRHPYSQHKPYVINQHECNRCLNALGNDSTSWAALLIDSIATMEMARGINPKQLETVVYMIRWGKISLEEFSSQDDRILVEAYDESKRAIYWWNRLCDIYHKWNSLQHRVTSLALFTYDRRAYRDIMEMRQNGIAYRIYGYPPTCTDQRARILLHGTAIRLRDLYAAAKIPGVASVGPYDARIKAELNEYLKANSDRNLGEGFDARRPITLTEFQELIRRAAINANGKASLDELLERYLEGYSLDGSGITLYVDLEEGYTLEQVATPTAEFLSRQLGLVVFRQNDEYLKASETKRDDTRYEAVHFVAGIPHVTPHDGFTVDALFEIKVMVSDPVRRIVSHEHGKYNWGLKYGLGLELSPRQDSIGAICAYHDLGPRQRAHLLERGNLIVAVTIGGESQDVVDIGPDPNILKFIKGETVLDAFALSLERLTHDFGIGFYPPLQHIVINLIRGSIYNKAGNRLLTGSDFHSHIVDFAFRPSAKSLDRDDSEVRRTELLDTEDTFVIELSAVTGLDSLISVCRHGTNLSFSASQVEQIRSLSRIVASTYLAYASGHSPMHISQNHGLARVEGRKPRVENLETFTDTLSMRLKADQSLETRIQIINLLKLHGIFDSIVEAQVAIPTTVEELDRLPEQVDLIMPRDITHIKANLMKGTPILQEIRSISGQLGGAKDLRTIAMVVALSTVTYSLPLTEGELVRFIRIGARAGRLVEGIIEEHIEIQVRRGIVSREMLIRASDDAGGEPLEYFQSPQAWGKELVNRLFAIKEA